MTPDPIDSAVLADLSTALGPRHAFSAVLVSVTTAVTDADRLADQLAGLSADASGWLSTTDAIYALRAGRWSQVSGRAGSAPPPTRSACVRTLAGELAVGPNRSLHLRRSEPHLLAIDVVEGEVDGCTAREWALVRSDRLVSTERTPGLRGLRYRVAWRRESQGTAPVVQVWRPWLARFCGWED